MKSRIKKIKERLNKIQKLYNRDRDDKIIYIYRNHLNSINKEFHKGNYDQVDKILNKLENLLDNENKKKKHLDNKLSVKGSRQEVGQEYLANPGINTTAVDPDGFDGSGNFNSDNGYGGWGNGSGGAYASATTANGACHSADRMFKLFKIGGSDGQFVNQTITALPAGNYNFGFWTKWSATNSDSVEELPTWSAEGNSTPKFTIKVKNAEGTWVNDHIHIPAEPTAAMTWAEDIGTWTNDEERDVRVQFYKNGGTSVAPTNLNNLWYIDTATLNFASYLSEAFDVTFSVNTANITVGDNGMYVGGGVLGGATAYPMSDDDSDGTWTVTIPLNEGTSGNYIFLNSPNNDIDWGAKEILSGLCCADPSNYNDRTLAPVTEDTTLLHCFGSCETDGSCPTGSLTDSVQVCATGADADPIIITLTPDDLTVNEGQEITAVSVTSGTIGSATFVGIWYDANLTVTGGVSDTVTATGLAEMACLDITGFTSVTMTSVDLDVYADSVDMCLNLSVTYGTPCTTPTDLTVSDISTTGALLSWVSDGSQFIIEIQPAGSPQGTDGGYTIRDIEAYTATAVDLANNTAYDMYVINVCDGESSNWAGPATFTTLPLPIVPDYTNDFSDFPGDLWSTYSPTGSFASAWLGDGFANDGDTGAAKTNVYSSNNIQVLESPIFDLSGGTFYLNMKAAVTVWNTTDSSAMGSDDKITVSVSVDGGDYVVLHTWNESNNPGPTGTDMPTVDLTSYSNTNVKFAITMSDGTVNDLEDYDFFVDDFSITALVCVDGCTDSLAFNYDLLATCDDGSCVPFVYGCTDPNAINYYPGANDDDGSCIYVGCTDLNASNYDPNATIDDGSCKYFNCSDPVPSGLGVNWTTDTKAEVTWDNMNDSSCMVWKYFVRYRVDNNDGTYGSWQTKSAGVGNGLCNFGLNTTIKRLQNLTSSTTYQFKMKAFYCGGTESGYSPPTSFTTQDDCPPMTNLSVTTFNSNQEKARFQWDSTGLYQFARIALRVDTVGATWQTASGFGVYYPTLQVNKFGLVPGESYRAQGRTFCDPNITSYRSFWTPPIFWTQPGTYDAISGCMDSEANNYNPDATVDDGSCIYKIGFLNPLTGPIDKFAPGFTAAANIAIDRLNNNHKGTATFELIEVDSGCDGGTVAGTAAKILVDAGVVAVSGAACTGASMAANAVLYAASIPQVSYASTSPDLSDATAYPLFWRVVPSDAQQGVCLANLVYSIGYNIVAVFHMKNDYAERTADSFNTAFKGDAELIGYDENADEDNLASSVNTYLDGSTYHAIVIISYDDDGAVLIKQIRAWNSDIPIFGADGIANDSFYNQFNDNSVLNNVYASRPVSGAVTKETTYFSGECTLNTDCSNSIYTAECYDSVKLIGDAIMSENGETLGDRIQNEGQQYQGASGIITFLDNGDVVGAGYNIMKFTGDSNTCDAYTWNIMDEIAGNDC